MFPTKSFLDNNIIFQIFFFLPRIIAIVNGDMDVDVLRSLQQVSSCSALAFCCTATSTALASTACTDEAQEETKEQKASADSAKGGQSDATPVFAKQAQPVFFTANNIFRSDSLGVRALSFRFFQLIFKCLLLLQYFLQISFRFNLRTASPPKHKTSIHLNFTEGVLNIPQVKTVSIASKLPQFCHFCRFYSKGYGGQL